MSETDQSALDRERARVRKLASELYKSQHGVKTHNGVLIRRDDKDSNPALRRRLGTDSRESGVV